MEDERTQPADETPEEWAHRMTGKLYGLLTVEISAFGGGEAFLRWVGSDEQEYPEFPKPCTPPRQCILIPG